ncbi:MULTISPECIES: ribosome silencing factor [Caloramator]|uniref:Ribosomal silencing factor RsfS n=1 Tax=Caloramator proteoclasticus DSM 10124 TaxID=1121262 RepID=A0A1M4TJY0_9CLOT|nr:MULTISPECIES: ribosome silencing factor [Caloramator]MCX7694393.1 ribosome silencing factor [Caloramator sp.]SHE44587.1 ribosome-associated protein [Caloramator proteoclasticus DSM 10124]
MGTSGMAYFIGKTASEKKARDIKILDVKGLSEIADYFVICSGTSTIQVKAIADEIEEKMAEKGYEINHKEGYNSGKWILLDYGEVIAHIFYEEDREFYDLERLWIDAEAISI